MDHPNRRHGAKDPSKFSLIVGLIFGFLTLSSLIVLILMALGGKEVPVTSRFLVIAILALGTSLTSALLGGHAVVTGKISLPISPGSAVKFSAAGGIGIFVIVMILGHVLYVTPGETDLIRGEGKGKPRPQTTIYEQKCVEARSAAEADALRALASNARVRIESYRKTTDLSPEKDVIEEWVNGVVSGRKIDG